MSITPPVTPRHLVYSRALRRRLTFPTRFSNSQFSNCSRSASANGVGVSFGSDGERICKSNHPVTRELSLPHLQPDFPPTAHSSVHIKTAVFLFMLLAFPTQRQASFLKFSPLDFFVSLSVVIKPRCQFQMSAR